jgi:hypothetical protein
MLTCMIPNLATLQALRAFEVSAGHLSYSRTIEELSLRLGQQRNDGGPSESIAGA